MSFVAKNHPQQVQERGALAHVDDRRTPIDLLEECLTLAEVSAFDLDVAASSENTKAPSYYTEADDGLKQPWSGHVWCNPPYSDIPAWIEKALAERHACKSITLLLPANRTEQKWWQEHIELERRSGSINVYFLKGRRRFDRPGWIKPKKGDRPPFGLCVVVIK